MKPIGFYVIDASGAQVAWHRTRRGAQQIAIDYSKRLGGIYYTRPEYAEASDAA